MHVFVCETGLSLSEGIDVLVNSQTLSVKLKGKKDSRSSFEFRLIEYHPLPDVTINIIWHFERVMWHLLHRSMNDWGFDPPSEVTFVLRNCIIVIIDNVIGGNLFSYFLELCGWLLLGIILSLFYYEYSLTRYCETQGVGIFLKV